MDFVYRLKDSVVQYLSPPQKRRRTTSPGSPSDDAQMPTLVSTSEPRDRKAQVGVLKRVTKIRLSPSDTRNSRKRTRDEHEVDEEDISPDDSISQVTPQGDDSEASEDVEDSNDVNDSDFEMESEMEGDEVEEDGSEATVDSNGVTDPDVEMVSEEEGSEGGAELDAAADQELELEFGEENELDGEEEIQEVEEEGSEDVATDQESDIEVVEEEIEEEDIDQEAVAEAIVQEYLARQAELALRKDEVEKVKAAGDWHPDEIFLFERLSMRSFEQVIPAQWQIDLPALPETLFTTDPEKMFVKNNCRSSYSGVRALQRLLVLGYRVRDRLLTPGLRPEQLITREIKAYIKWAENDGDYRKRRFIPVLTLVSARRRQTTDSLSNSITNEMMFLAQKHRENLATPSEEQNGAVTYKRQPPLLYGIIVAQSMAIFVTLDSANPDAKVRHLTHFDFKEKDMVVWNGFAIAFIITMAKDYIISIRDDLEIDDTPDTDVDA